MKKPSRKQLTPDPALRIGHKTNSRCIICTAKAKNGQLIRYEIERLVSMGLPQREVVEQVNAKWDLTLTQGSLSRHIRNHAPYLKLESVDIRQLKKQRELLLKVQDEFADANEALQRIINIGDHKIKTGQMPVSETLFIKALQEQGKRRQASRIDIVLVDMEKHWLKKGVKDAEIVREEKKHTEARLKDNLKREKKELKRRKENNDDRASRPIRKELGKRIPQPGVVRNFVHV